jgi:Tol biopolymer transport system component
MRTRILVALMAVITGAATAQLSVVRTERISMAPGEWKAAEFSPNGAALYVTTPEHNGIWEFGLLTGKLRQITAERGTGFGFAVSPDGERIAYLRRGPVVDRLPQKEMVVRSLRTGTARVEQSGGEISFPAFSRNGAAYVAIGSAIRSTASIAAQEIAVVGIERGKILLQKNGKKVLFDPVGNGNYVWPSLSPDGTMLVAYEGGIGAFVCDLSGKLLARLGRKDAPTWSRDGKWIIYMDDRDDGHQILTSEIGFISPDGKVQGMLTSTPGIHEMYPRCSPTEDRILCSTPTGELYSISYREGGR